MESIDRSMVSRSIQARSAAAAAAALKAGSLVAPSNADIVYVDVGDVSLTNREVPFDINGDDVVDFEMHHHSFEAEDLVYSAEALFVPSIFCAVAMEGEATTLFQRGMPIDGSRPYFPVESYFAHNVLVSGQRTDGGFWYDDGAGLVNGYAGFRLSIDGSAHYGWARISVAPYADDIGALTMTVHDFAYEDAPGAAIPAGAIPAPSTFALLATGALGTTLVRRRQSLSAR